MMSDAQATQVIAVALASRVLKRAPTDREIVFGRALGRHEGLYGSWMGAHNWGAVQCKSGPPCGEGCFEHLDHHGDGTEYHWCYKQYGDDISGAADMLRIAYSPNVLKHVNRGDIDAATREMSINHYFEADPNDYAQAIERNYLKAARTLGEKIILHRGMKSVTSVGDSAAIVLIEVGLLSLRKMAAAA